MGAVRHQFMISRMEFHFVAAKAARIESLQLRRIFVGDTATLRHRSRTPVPAKIGKFLPCTLPAIRRYGFDKRRIKREQIDILERRRLIENVGRWGEQRMRHRVVPGHENNRLYWNAARFIQLPSGSVLLLAGLFGLRKIVVSAAAGIERQRHQAEPDEKREENSESHGDIAVDRHLHIGMGNPTLPRPPDCRGQNGQKDCSNCYSAPTHNEAFLHRAPGRACSARCMIAPPEFKPDAYAIASSPENRKRYFPAPAARSATTRAGS